MIKKLEELKNHKIEPILGYYDKNINVALEKGLAILIKEKPKDPIKYLGNFLIDYI